MNKALLVAFALFQPFSANAAPIVGGEVVRDLSEAPFIVQLADYRTGVVCGGTVIAEDWVLTAGHCKSSISQTNLYAGTLGVGTEGNDGLKLSPGSIYRHPKYREVGDDARWDFLLIHLRRKIDFAHSKIKPVRLPDESFIARGGQNPGVLATTFGWGLLDENDKNGSDTLLRVSLPIVSDLLARRSYPGRIDESMIPAGYENGGKDSCNGDSGGPLTVYDPVTQSQVLVGIVSWGDGCARKDKYGIYSKVSVVLDWIQKTRAKFSPKVPPEEGTQSGDQGKSL